MIFRLVLKLNILIIQKMVVMKLGNVFVMREKFLERAEENKKEELIGKKK
jgi:hypothetical protein